MATLEWRGDAAVVRSKYTIDLANHVKGNQVSIVINTKTLVITSLTSGSPAMVTAILAAFLAVETPPEFKELVASDTTDLERSTDSQVTLLGPDDGTPIVIDSISTTGGGTTTDEVQTLSITETPTADTYQLAADLDGQGEVNATVTTAFGDNAAAIQVDLETIRGADVVTNGNFGADSDWLKGSNWRIAGGVADQSTPTASDLSQVPTIPLVAGRSYEVVFTVSNFVAGTVTPKVGGTSGTARSSDATFTEIIVAGADGKLTFTASATFNMDIDVVTLKAAVNTNDIIVTGGPLAKATDIIFTFSGAGYDDENVRLIAIDTDGLTFTEATGVATITETTPGRGSINAVMRLTMTNLPASGNFTLGVDDTGSNLLTTANIVAAASEDTIQTALNLLSNVSAGDIIVSRGPLTTDYIEFTFAGNFAATKMILITFTDVSLAFGTGETTGTGSVEHRAIGHGVNDEAQLSEIDSAEGPNHWVAGNFRVANALTNQIPVNGDTVTFVNNSVSCLFGIDQNAVVLAVLNVDASYTGLIGLLETNNRSAGNANSPYAEYREVQLKIGATILNIGKGTGAGSGRIRINTGTDQTATKIYKTGSHLDSDYGAVMLAGSHSSSTLEVLGGTVDVSPFPGETSEYLSITVRGGSVRASSGIATLPTAILENSGSLNIDESIATLTARGFSSLVISIGITTATIEDNASIDVGSTITTLKMGGASKARVTGAITTASVDGTSELTAEAAITNFSASDKGTVNLREGGILATAIFYGKLLVVANSSAVTFATLDMASDSTIDLRGSKAAITITATMNISAKGVTILDPLGRLSGQDVNISFGRRQDVDWQSPAGVTITES